MSEARKELRAQAIRASLDEASDVLDQAGVLAMAKAAGTLVWDDAGGDGVFVFDGFIGAVESFWCDPRGAAFIAANRKAVADLLKRLTGEATGRLDAGRLHRIAGAITLFGLAARAAGKRVRELRAMAEQAAPAEAGA